MTCFTQLPLIAVQNEDEIMSAVCAARMDNNGLQSIRSARDRGVLFDEGLELYDLIRNHRNTSSKHFAFRSVE